MTIDLKEVWNKTLSDIELDVSRANFSTWFKNTNLVKEEGGTIYIGVQNEFVKEWLQNKYHKIILKCLRNRMDNVRNIEYIVSKNFFQEKNTDETPEVAKKPSNNKTLPFSADHYINKEDNLNPRYTFDSFVVGPFNELAYAAGQAILKNPSVYNPLFIYGDTGLGKTHLIQSVGNFIKKNHPDKKVFYTSSEKFSLEYTNSVHSGKINSFKEKYRKFDFLIMDDIQFLSKKEKTQEELFHLFNSLYEKNKQIIFSSDKHPNYIPSLEDRLKSRFSAGMIVDIHQPEYESRIAILKNKAKIAGFDLSDDTLNYVASNIEGNIRELEGILNSIICQVELKGKELSQTDLKNLIKNNLKPKKNISIKEVVKNIAAFYNIDENDIYQKTRRKEVVKSRQVAMYILREDFNVSYPLIGRQLGGKDHTTVIHSCSKVKNALKEDNLLVQEIEQIRVMF